MCPDCGFCDKESPQLASNQKKAPKAASHEELDFDLEEFDFDINDQ